VFDGIAADKTSVVADALGALGTNAGANVVLIGDRSHDVIGAHANGIACVGALWGYGSREELTTSGADAIVADVEELADWLGVSAADAEEVAQ
jgi:phosphoglycolate phosphatase